MQPVNLASWFAFSWTVKPYDQCNTTPRQNGVRGAERSVLSKAADCFEAVDSQLLIPQTGDHL